MTINEYFNDHIYVINLARRTDRWQHVQRECDKHALQVIRFEGIDLKNDGNTGCTESHGALLHHIVAQGYERTLILEDDFEFRFDDTQEQFSRMVDQLPADWFMFYLGGHYGSDPVQFVAENVIRIRHMKTTSSYAVTLEAAKTMAPFIKGIGPIDELYLQWHLSQPCYCFEPRLAVQYTSFSDLQMREMNNQMCMEDTRHIDELRKRTS